MFEVRWTCPICWRTIAGFSSEAEAREEARIHLMLHSEDEES